MSKIPKEIVDKIEQRNKLNEEIEIWCKENLDMDGMCSDDADITNNHTGDGKELTIVKNGVSSGRDIAKIIITVIITGKQSIQENICTCAFGHGSRGGGNVEQQGI